MFLLKKDFIYLPLEKGKGGRKKGKHPCVRDTSIVSCTPPTGGPGPQTRHMPFIGNRTGDLLVSGPVLSAPSHSNRGSTFD